jgi:hypothetical protein
MLVLQFLMPSGTCLACSQLTGTYGQLCAGALVAGLTMVCRTGSAADSRRWAGGLWQRNDRAPADGAVVEDAANPVDRAVRVQVVVRRSLGGERLC